MLATRDIPRLAERRLVNALWNEFGAAAERQNYTGTRRREDWAIFRAVWSGHLNDRPMTERAIERATGIPHATVIRKLGRLRKQAKVEQIGQRFYIPDRLLLSTTGGPRSLLDQNIDAILNTADQLRALRAVNRKQRMALPQVTAALNSALIESAGANQQHQRTRRRHK